MVKKTMRYVLIIITSILFTGCFVNKDLRKKAKALRKIERAKELAPSLFRVDTVVIIDTIVFRDVKYDTVKAIVRHDTTVIINNDKVFAKYYYDTLRQEIWHEITCRGDTVYFEKKVPIERFGGLTVIDMLLMNWWLVLLFVIALFLFKKR